MNSLTSNPQDATRMILAAVALCTALAAAARAGGATRIHVQYADLNVNSTAGATQLYQRIRLAADEVCRVNDEREPERIQKARTCAERIVADAVAAADLPRLTTVHQGTAAAPGSSKLASID